MTLMAADTVFSLFQNNIFLNYVDEISTHQERIIIPDMGIIDSDYKPFLPSFTTGFGSIKVVLKYSKKARDALDASFLSNDSHLYLFTTEKTINNLSVHEILTNINEKINTRYKQRKKKSTNSMFFEFSGYITVLSIYREHDLTTIGITIEIDRAVTVLENNHSFDSTILESFQAINKKLNKRKEKEG